MQKQYSQPQRPLQECKAKQQQKWSSTTNVFDEVLSSRDVANIPEKKEVRFARQTSEQETISLDGGLSSLTDSNDSSRLSYCKMYSFYKNQEISRRNQMKPSLKKKTLKIS